MRIMCISGCAAGRFAHPGLSGRGSIPLRGAVSEGTRHDARSDDDPVSILLTREALPAARSAALHECHHDSADDVPLVPPTAARSASPYASQSASLEHPAVCESPLQAQCPSDKDRCLPARAPHEVQSASHAPRGRKPSRISIARDEEPHTGRLTGSVAEWVPQTAQAPLRCQGYAPCRRHHRIHTVVRARFGYPRWAIPGWAPQDLRRVDRPNPRPRVAQG